MSTTSLEDKEVISLLQSLVDSVKPYYPLYIDEDGRIDIAVAEAHEPTQRIVSQVNKLLASRPVVVRDIITLKSFNGIKFTCVIDHDDYRDMPSHFTLNHLINAGHDHMDRIAPLK